MSDVGFRPPISVFVTHPDASTRGRLVADLEGTGITVVGESDGGEGALEAMLDAAPDVALIAADDERSDGPALCAGIRQALPVCRVLLVAEDDGDDAWRGLAAGAYGCYLLGEPGATLHRAIRGTMRRESLPTPGWAERILATYQELADAEDARIVPAPHLTPTEQEVLNRLAAGAAAEQIAQLHDVTTHMVRLHAGYAIIKLYRAMADERQLQALR